MGLAESAKVARVYRRGVLWVFLAWALFALAWTASSRFADLPNRRFALAHPVMWRTGHPGSRQLEATLKAALPQIPDGSLVGFSSSLAPDSYYVFQWASYLLPERQLVDLRDIGNSDGVAFVLRYGTAWYGPRFEVVRKLPGGWLYRVRGEPPRAPRGRPHRPHRPHRREGAPPP